MHTLLYFLKHEYFTPNKKFEYTAIPHINLHKIRRFIQQTVPLLHIKLWLYMNQCL